MRNLLVNIKNTLNNEEGGPNVEEVVGIAVALSVGVGLFIFGKYVYQWYNGCAGNTVKGIQVPPPSDFQY